MGFLQSMRVTGLAVLQILLLGAIGYLLVKKNILKDEGLDALSRLAIDVTLPVLIFCQLVRDFSFQQYATWWLFPLLSIAISIAGFVAGCIFVGFLKGEQRKVQFLSLVSFQNSGYLPLVLIAGLLPLEKVGTMFIYLFLFLTGFNLLMFSAGVHLLTFHKERRFEWESLFSPPVVATIAGLAVVFFGLGQFVPQTVLKPLRMLGDCTLPLAMLVVGASLAQIKLKQVNLKAMALMVAAKMIILPLLGLWLVLSLKLPQLLGLLIVIQLAMPPATTLSLIIRHYNKEDLLISQGIFIGHIVGLFSVPLILSLYFMHFMIR
ncbi:MAG TPA: AEC family transporter [Candidatus Margulisiibacteriota bacterium]|nr:AEC family transporter [Candidatus Margulisiibacteriota bacterium]